MTSIRLFSEFGNIDTKYILEADVTEIQFKKNKSNKKRILLIAAILILALGTITFAFGWLQNRIQVSESKFGFKIGFNKEASGNYTFETPETELPPTTCIEYTNFQYHNIEDALKENHLPDIIPEILKNEYTNRVYGDNAISPFITEYLPSFDSIITLLHFDYAKDVKTIQGVLEYHPLHSDKTEFIVAIQMIDTYEYKNIDGYTYTISTYTYEEIPDKEYVTAIISVGEYNLLLTFTNHTQGEIESILDSVNVKQLENYSDIVLNNRNKISYTSMQKALTEHGFNLDVNKLEKSYNPQGAIIYQENHLLDPITLQQCYGTYLTEKGLHFTISASLAQVINQDFCFSSGYSSDRTQYTNAHGITFYVYSVDSNCIHACIYEKNLVLELTFEDCTTEQIYPILDCIDGNLTK